MIDPNPPPSRMARTSSNTWSSFTAAPPEKMTMRRPLNAACTTWRTRSASVAHRAGDGLVGILLFEEDVVIVELEDERHTARELAGARLQEAERRRVRVAAGLDGELEVVARIVRRRVDREAARRAVLDALV